MIKKLKIFIISLASLIVSISVFSPVKVSARPVVTADQILFDAEFYERVYPEVVSTYGSGFDAMYRHYLEHGRAEGKLPYEGAIISSELFYKAPATRDENLPGQISINPAGKNIYVGDSRTYIMHQNIGDDGNTWIGFPGSGFATFSTTAATTIDGMNISQKNIIILYGINDVMGGGANASFNNYNVFLRTKAQEWIKKGAKVYFVNLCGVNNDLANAVPTATPDQVNYINGNVAKFNKLIKSFPANVRKITVSYGKNPEYDGIHYTPETCLSVYKQINSCLK